MTQYKINKYLKEINNYRNLYKKYKRKYQKKAINGGFLNDEVKTYQNKLNEYKDKIIDIINRKNNLYFIQYSYSELKQQIDSIDNPIEKDDLDNILNSISQLNQKNKIEIDNIYNLLLLFLKKYNYTNLIKNAQLYFKKKNIERYEQLIIEFDINNYNRDGFRKYHNLNELPKDINLFKSSRVNHYKQPKLLKVNIQNFFKKLLNNFFN